MLLYLLSGYSKFVSPNFALNELPIIGFKESTVSIQWMIK